MTTRNESEREVALLERRRLDALITKDGGSLQSLMSDNCVVLYGTNEIDREKFLSMLARTDTRAIEQLDVNIRAFGDATVVIVSTTELTAGTSPESSELRRAQHKETSVWCKEATTGWRLNTLSIHRIVAPAA